MILLLEEGFTQCLLLARKAWTSIWTLSAPVDDINAIQMKDPQICRPMVRKSGILEGLSNSFMNDPNFKSR